MFSKNRFGKLIFQYEVITVCKDRSHEIIDLGAKGWILYVGLLQFSIFAKQKRGFVFNMHWRRYIT